MNDIKVIGIDPAPSKKSTIFVDGEFEHKDYASLKKYLSEELEKNKQNLICWDAPLTFPFIPETKPEEYSPLYMRPIEYFFNFDEDIKPPKGISVLGYAGCSHWAISQYILGYPRPEVYSDINPRYKLICKDSQEISKESENGIYITEVHPALAIWFYLKDIIKDSNNFNWKYKNSSSSRIGIVKILKDNVNFKDMPDIKNDDELDAYIAWKLGNDWINDEQPVVKKVCILGNEETGSFLLPYDEPIFNNFKKNELK